MLVSTQAEFVGRPGRLIDCFLTLGGGERGRWEHGGEGGMKGRRDKKRKSDEMQRLLAWLHRRLGAHLRCALCWEDSHIQPNPSTNLSAWAAVTFTKLPSKHTLSSGGDVTFILSCTGDMGIFFLCMCVCTCVCCCVSACSRVALLFGVNSEEM